MTWDEWVPARPSKTTHKGWPDSENYTVTIKNALVISSISERYFHKLLWRKVALLTIRLLQVAFWLLVRNFSSEEVGGHVIMDHNIRRQLWMSNHSDRQAGVCVVMGNLMATGLEMQYYFMWVEHVSLEAPTAADWEVDKWSWKDTHSKQLLLAE